MLKRDGSVWTAGRNIYGALGDESKTDSTRFKKVIDSGVKAVATGYSHTAVLKQDGSVWATGRNHLGQLGDGTTTDR